MPLLVTRVVHALALAFALAHCIAAPSSSPSPAPQPPVCSIDAQQFTVTVDSSEPLGLRLGDRLEILEFVADYDGRSRAVEASGLAEIGDRLVQVNNVSLSDMTLREAVAELAAAELPKVLRFQAHDGRCMAPLNSDSDTIAPETAADTVAASSFDDLVMSYGDADTEESFYAVLSNDGRAPSCEFRELVIAQPIDACDSLDGDDAVDKIVLVPSIFGCPMHQKAAFVQEAGAIAMIVVQRFGEKPQKIKLPDMLPTPIRMPLVMVAASSGLQMLDMAARIPPGKELRVRFVLSEECAASKYQIHPQNDPLLQVTPEITTSAQAGYVTVTISRTAASVLSTTTFEFIRSPASTGLPKGKKTLLLPSMALVDACRDDPPASPDVIHAEAALEGFVVATAARDECSLTGQVEFFHSHGVVAVILADTTFPHVAINHELDATDLPIVFVSKSSLRTMRRQMKQLRQQLNETELAHVNVLVEFSGENALHQQWRDLADLSDPDNWPTDPDKRERLVHRMMKDHAQVDDQLATKHGLSLSTSERYDALITAYWAAQAHYAPSSDIDPTDDARM
ncbi:TPA: hypothetical protein N0F65_011405 [Lagenidium giganteum]|uniref:PDZ domain-containing protein n=1 Tax=Lagenidium giganteum TaxID=4803 RepID=A0AAV2ZBV1_9STRA|nr:TPA: hypothetical protein N0F65_011405 [Lagenidium giganteum]